MSKERKLSKEEFKEFFLEKFKPECLKREEGDAIIAADIISGLKISCITTELDSLYESYLKTESDEAFYDYVKELYNQIGWEDGEALEDIIATVVNTESNAESLKWCPHRQFKDTCLSIVYRKLFMQNGKFCTMSITNFLADMYGLSEEKLYETAIKNHTCFNLPVIDSLDATITHIENGNGAANGFTVGIDSIPKELFESDVMFTITNKIDLGSCALLNTEAFSVIAEAAGKNLYIIPSSTMELLVVLDYKEKTQSASLLDMLLEGNSDIEQNIFLADSLFYFDRDKKELSQIK